MKTILNSILEEIARAAERGDVSEVTRLTPLAERAKRVKDEEEALQAAIARPKGNNNTVAHLTTSGPPVNGSARITRNATRGGLRVELTLPRGGRLDVEERTAAETLVVLMERLLAEYGENALQKLQNIRTGRGPLLSRNPQADFLNPRRRELYAHHRIPGSEFYVLTHSSTPEKVEQIERALRTVGMAPHSFQVRRRND